MKNKRGASAVLAYVLLITLTVILAVTVTVFMKNKAKTQVEQLTEEVGTRLDCENVAINSFLDSGDVVVINVGSRTIDAEIRYRDNVGLFRTELIPDIKPKQAGAGSEGDFKKSKTLNDRSGPVDVIPKIKLGKKMVGCADKKATVGCKTGEPGCS